MKADRWLADSPDRTAIYQPSTLCFIMDYASADISDTFFRILIFVCTYVLLSIVIVFINNPPYILYRKSTTLNPYGKMFS